MLNLAAFRVDFPEFRTLPDPFVQSALDKAELRTDAAILGTLTDEYHGNKTADIITSRPSGGSAVQSPKTDSSKNVYAMKCTELEQLVGGFRGELPDV